MHFAFRSNTAFGDRCFAAAISGVEDLGLHGIGPNEMFRRMVLMLTQNKKDASL